MKKILFMAMVAIAFMSCNGSGDVNNGSGTPAKDQKAITSVTVEAVDLIGQDAASVDKVLTSAGFKQMDEEVLAAPVKKLKALKTSDENPYTFVSYFYNLPDNADKMTEDEATQYLANLFAKNQFYIAAVVVLINDKVAGVETALLTGVGDKVNLTYTDISDKLYKSLPENAAFKEWQGKLAVEGGEAQRYDKQEDYVAAIAKAKAVQAEEQGLASLSGAEALSGLMYTCLWVRPSDEEANVIKEELGYVCTNASFIVADIALASDL